MKTTPFVSVHGGHSGQFCEHATDNLEEIIKRYIEMGFTWAGITEHSPAISESLLDPGQRRAGLTPDGLLNKFGSYMQECRKLQKKYQEKITIFAAMEIETYSGYQEFVPFLINTFRPDYIVGSVHYVDDIIFDYSSELYQKAAKRAGGIENLYLRYFDQQYEMIQHLSPSVVGHFDLIRIFDPDYSKRLQEKAIVNKIERNLELIKQKNLILDFNLRAMFKGAEEPYVSRSILEKALEMEIAVVPGDDSHSVSSVGGYLVEGIKILTDMGFTTDWPRPQLLSYV